MNQQEIKINSLEQFWDYCRDIIDSFEIALFKYYKDDAKNVRTLTDGWVPNMIYSKACYKYLLCSSEYIISDFFRSLFGAPASVFTDTVQPDPVKNYMDGLIMENVKTITWNTRFEGVVVELRESQPVSSNFMMVELTIELYSSKIKINLKENN